MKDEGGRMKVEFHPSAFRFHPLLHPLFIGASLSTQRRPGLQSPNRYVAIPFSSGHLMYNIYFQRMAKRKSGCGMFDHLLFRTSVPSVFLSASVIPLFIPYSSGLCFA